MSTFRITLPLLAASLLLSGLSSCDNSVTWSFVHQQIEEDYPHAQSITVDSLAQWLDDPSLDPPILLDVREEEEFAVSHLLGATRVDPDETAFAFLEHAQAATPIVTYCSVGHRSAAVAERLQNAGFINVHNLEGSIFKWANEGHPVYRDGEGVEEVHPYDRWWGQLLQRPLRASEPSEE